MKKYSMEYLLLLVQLKLKPAFWEEDEETRIVLTC